MIGRVEGEYSLEHRQRLRGLVEAPKAESIAVQCPQEGAVVKATSGQQAIEAGAQREFADANRDVVVGHGILRPVVESRDLQTLCGKPSQMEQFAANRDHHGPVHAKSCDCSSSLARPTKNPHGLGNVKVPRPFIASRIEYGHSPSRSRIPRANASSLPQRTRHTG